MAVRISARRARKALPAWTRSLDAHITASSTKSIGSTIGGWSRTPKSGDLGPKRRAMTLIASSWATAGRMARHASSCSGVPVSASWLGSLLMSTTAVAAASASAAASNWGRSEVEDFVGRAPAQLFEEPFNDHALRALTQDAPVVGVVLQLGCGSDQFGCPVRFTFRVCVDDWRAGSEGAVWSARSS